MLVLLVMVWLPVWAQPADACAPQVLAVQAARAQGDGSARPTQGWEPVELPDVWTRRWPQHEGSVWYRIDWKRGCTGGAEPVAPVALGVDGLSIAGEVFSNGDLLWRDASLVEPLSRSWNVPRWWLLPASSLHAGTNSIWVRAVGMPALSPGMGALRLGDAATVAEQYGHSLWRQRTVYFANAVLCAMAGALFLLVWLLHRQERAYGWFGLMALAWLAYLTTYLAETPWPWPDSLARSRFSLVALVGYVLCVCMFTLRFGGQQLPRVERVLWGLAALGAGAAVLAPREAAGAWFGMVWQGAMAVFLLNGLQFQWHAWRPRPGGRKMRHMLLALCWLVFVVVALNNLFSVLDRWQVARDWAAMSGLLVIVLVMLLLGGQLVQQMRNMERFNHTLAERVADAREQLAQAQAREHAQALEHAKLQERMRIAHDLHDGLGGSLVRGMALVEQAREALPNERVLSLLKSLRDDLRQVIDHGSSAGASVPATPVQWAAPLRHRFTRILDELGVASQWNIAPQWAESYRPSALQCLGLTRLVEEALSNVIKHSRARHLRVDCAQPRPGVLAIGIEDDGIGFDLGAVQRAGLSVGMRSMAARAERIGGLLTLESGPCGTVVSVELVLPETPQ
ncbi:MAG: sensor histidine kinase [Comamonas sp.]